MSNSKIETEQTHENVKLTLDDKEKERFNQRFTHNFNRFVSCDFTTLTNGEFLQEFVRRCSTGLDFGKDDINGLLEALTGAVLVGNLDARQRCLPILYQIGEIYLADEEKDQILCLHTILREWFAEEEEILPGADTIIKTLINCVEWLLFHNYLEELVETFTIWQGISREEVTKSQVIRGMAGRSLDYFRKKSFLAVLTDTYLKDSDKRDAVTTIMQSLAPASGVYLLEKSLESQDRAERGVLLDLVATFERHAVAAIGEILRSKPAKEDLEVILPLLQQVGGQESIELAQNLHTHEDESIQLLSVGIVAHVAGNDASGELCYALDVVSAPVKLHILRLLLGEGVEDEVFFETLCDLALQGEDFDPDISHQILISVLTGLKKFPKEETVEVLQKMKQIFSEKKNIKQVELLVDEALHYIEPKLRHKGLSGGNASDDVSFDFDPVEQNLSSKKVREIENTVQKLIKTGELKKASVYIYNQAVIASSQSDFTVAEMLRDRLLEVDPYALTEVVRLGELIEETKSGAITPHHLEIWKELCEKITEEEYSVIYHNFRLENYAAEQIIVKSGETDNSLFFLNSGNVSLHCGNPGNQSFLRKYGPGDILGGEQFFSASVWTVTLTAMTDVQLHVLDRKGWGRAIQELPQLEAKIVEFNNKYKRIADLLKMTGDERRIYFRHSVTIPSRHFLIDQYGRKNERSCRGELIDISQGGVAFSVKLANKDVAQGLLGRQIVTTIEINNETREVAGLVVGVRQQDPLEKTYSVHIKLAEELDEGFCAIVQTSE